MNAVHFDEYEGAMTVTARTPQTMTGGVWFRFIVQQEDGTRAVCEIDEESAEELVRFLAPYTAARLARTRRKP